MSDNFKTVFSISNQNPDVALTDQMREKLNFFYAKNYLVDTDVAVILGNILRK